MSRSRTIAAIAAGLAIFYFLPIHLPYKICLTVGFLAIGAMGSLPWLMVLAFVFSCAGDAMGSANNFPMQMLAFLLAHVSMIVFFCGRLRGGKDILDKRALASLSILLCIAALSFIKIVPGAPAGIIRAGVVAYTILLSLMCWTASLQGNKYLTIGAFLFLISDLILAWNKFTSPIPSARYLIMILYYAGQIGLFLGVDQLENDTIR